MGKDKETKKEETTNLPKIKYKKENRFSMTEATVVDIEVTGKTSDETLGTFKEVLELVK